VSNTVDDIAAIQVDPEVYLALVALRDDLSRARQRDVSLAQVVADLLDHFIRHPPAAAQADRAARPGDRDADGHRQPPP
jgi:hypothetical protein